MIRLAIAGVLGRMGRTIAELALRDHRFEIVAALTQPGDSHVGSAISLGDGSLAIVDRLSAQSASGGGDRLCDVLIDFTVANGTMHWLDACVRRKIPMVIGATGHDEAELARIKDAAASIPIVKATNFSPGVQALLNAVSRLVVELGSDYDIEIVETHHKHKVDAPSGTALTILEAIRIAQATALGDQRQTPLSPPLPRPISDLARGDEGAGAVRLEGADGTRPMGPTLFGRHGRTGERKPGEIAVHAVRMGEHVGQHEIYLSAAGETITVRHTAHSREAFAGGALRAAAWIVGKPPGQYSMHDVIAVST